MVDFWSSYRMTIDGKLLSADRQIQVFNPATGKVVATVPEASQV